MKKFVLGAAVAALGALALVSCGPKNNGGQDSGNEFVPGKTVQNGKIGFILPGSESAETKAFKANWEALAKEYGVKVTYKNFSGVDPSKYATLADELIAEGVNAIICNFEMDGKESVVEKCIKNEIYCGYSGSSLDETTFNEYANEAYFLGQIAPDAAEEQSQAYTMTKFYIEKYYGANKEALPNGCSDKFAVWPADFHGINLKHQMTYRWKGIKQALAEYGVIVKGDEKDDSANWTCEYKADSILKDKVLIMGNNLANFQALMAQCGGVLKQQPCVIVTTCMADFLLSQFTRADFAMASETRFATIDSFADEYAKWYNADANSQINAFKVAHEPYIVGKYQAINNAIIALTASSFNGTPIRDNGKAVNIKQHYWVAKNKAEFEKANVASKSFKITKADLDKCTTAEQLQQLFNNATLENASK